MSPSDSSTPSVYDRCDPVYLRDLREAAGMDIHVLARKACLSVGQIRELESELNGNSFYSDAIKQQAYKRVLMLLGAVPPQTNAPKHLSAPPQDLDTRLAPLDSIAAMSHRPAVDRSVGTTLQLYVEKLKEHKSTFSLSVLFALALAGMTQYTSQHGYEAAKTAVPQAVVQPAIAKPSPPASVAVANVTPPAPVVPASAPATVFTAEFKCAFSKESMPQWTPTQARKEGRYVYVMSDTLMDVCVVDGQKRATRLQMKAGESQSVYGTGPWQISGQDLQKIKIYFQGNLVIPPEGTTQTLSLVEAPVTP